MLQFMCDSLSRASSGAAGLEGAGCGQRRHVGTPGRWHLRVEAVDRLSGGAVACAGVQVCSTIRVVMTTRHHCGMSPSSVPVMYCILYLNGRGAALERDLAPAMR